MAQTFTSPEASRHPRSQPTRAGNFGLIGCVATFPPRGHLLKRFHRPGYPYILYSCCFTGCSARLVRSMRSQAPGNFTSRDPKEIHASFAHGAPRRCEQWALDDDDDQDDFNGLLLAMHYVISCKLLRKRSWPRSNPYATLLNLVVRPSGTEPVAKLHSETTKCKLFVKKT
jgi:hypothetical protein